MSAKTTPPIPPPSSGSPATSSPHAPDLRPHVAALLELSALGWRVTEIRPDLTAPVLWRVTIERHDRCASITVTELDPDEALDQVLRYAVVDGEKPYEMVNFAPASESPAGTTGPTAAPSATPGAAHPEEP